MKSLKVGILKLNTLRPLPNLTFTVLHKAEIAHLSALTEGLGALEVYVVKVPVIDDVAVTEHLPKALQQIPFIIRNARTLRMDLADVDYVFLSHGHNDHAGGLRSFLEINDKAKVAGFQGWNLL